MSLQSQLPSDVQDPKSAATRAAWNAIPGPVYGIVSFFAYGSLAGIAFMFGSIV